MINRTGIENVIRLTAAIGGSTNVALHLPAIGYEAGVSVPMTLFDELCRSTPHIAKMNPAAAANVPGFHRAGGVPAVMKEILPLSFESIIIDRIPSFDIRHSVFDIRFSILCHFFSPLTLS